MNPHEEMVGTLFARSRCSATSVQSRSAVRADSIGKRPDLISDNRSWPGVTRLPLSKCQTANWDSDNSRSRAVGPDLNAAVGTWLARDWYVLVAKLRGSARATGKGSVRWWI
jgi:hypothetical protein